MTEHVNSQQTAVCVRVTTAPSRGFIVKPDNQLTPIIPQNKTFSKHFTNNNNNDKADYVFPLNVFLSRVTLLYVLLCLF